MRVIIWPPGESGPRRPRVDSYVPSSPIEHAGKLRIHPEVSLLALIRRGDDLTEAGVALHDTDPLVVHLDHVVRGPRVAAHAMTRRGAGVDQQHAADLPDVGHVLVPRL